MKQFFSILLAISFIFILFISCGEEKAPVESESQTEQETQQIEEPATESESTETEQNTEDGEKCQFQIVESESLETVSLRNEELDWDLNINFKELGIPDGLYFMRDYYGLSLSYKKVGDETQILGWKPYYFATNEEIDEYDPISMFLVVEEDYEYEYMQDSTIVSGQIYKFDYDLPNVFSEYTDYVALYSFDGKEWYTQAFRAGLEETPFYGKEESEYSYVLFLENDSVTDYALVNGISVIHARLGAAVRLEPGFVVYNDNDEIVSMCYEIDGEEIAEPIDANSYVIFYGETQEVTFEEY